MKDPARMTELGADATVIERELVRAGRGRRLPERERRALWAGIAAQCISPPVTGDGASATASQGAASGATAAAGGSALTLVKATLLTAVLGAGSAAGYQVWRYRAPEGPAATTGTAAPQPSPSPVSVTPPSRPPAVVAPTPSPATTLDSPVVHSHSHSHSHSPAPSAAVPVAPAPASAVASSSKKSPPSRLDAEGSAVLEARARLREGRPEDALRLLDAARLRFGDGALAQEREALAVEALARSGQREAAAVGAAAFLRAFPGSPHAARVQSFVSP